MLVRVDTLRFAASFRVYFVIGLVLVDVVMSGLQALKACLKTMWKEGCE